MTAQCGLDELAPARIPPLALGVYRHRARPARPAAAVRALAAVAVVSVGACTLGIALLHVLPAGRMLNPVSAPISNYALTPVGWLFDLAVVVLALGLAALLGALVVGGRVGTPSSGFAVLSTCCLGLVAIVVFPDRTSAGALTTAGQMHWSAAMATFAGIPAASALLDRPHAPGLACSRLPGIARWLCLAATGWFAVLFVGSIVQFSTSLTLWRLGGAVERVLAITEMLIVVVLATWVWRGNPCRCQRAAAGAVRRPHLVARFATRCSTSSSSRTAVP